MARALTTKQRQFIKNKAKGMTNVAAAMDAYKTDNYKVASVTAAHNIENPRIADAIEKAFERAGITHDSIVAPIADGLQATTTVIVRDKAARRRIPGETDEQYEERQTDASFIDERPDNGTRLRAADLAAKLLKIGKNNKGDDPAPTGIVFNVQNNYLKGQ